jgi:deoxyadenosine/deoxycytidine kinase
MSYKKECMYCKKEIEMSDRAAGQWLPYEPGDGNLHDCKVKKYDKQKANNSVKSPAPEKEQKPQLKTILEAQVFLERIDARVRKLESMVLGK